MLGQTLSKQLKRGKLRRIGKPLYEGLIASQLWWLRWNERKLPAFDAPLVDEKLTAIIKTFERPETVARLLKSLRRFYPNMRVIVVDDSAKPIERAGVQNIHLPYDSGVSAGRQKALEAVQTPYVLLLDDDFIFYALTRLEEALERIEKEEKIDIMGGEVINLPSFRSADYRHARLHRTDAGSLMPPGSRMGGLPVYDKVPNFYIARTQRLKLVGWDARIKRLDHADFFTRAKGVLLTVYNKEFKILHAQTPHNTTYMRKRHEVEQDRMVLRMKYYADVSGSAQSFNKRQKIKR